MIMLLLASIASLKTLPGAVRPHLTTVLPALEATTEKKPIERNQWPRLAGGSVLVARLTGDFCADAGALITFLVVHRHPLRHAK